MKKRKKLKNTHQPHQIGIFDIKLDIGDKIYRNGEFYGELSGESETLYFIKRTHDEDAIANPYEKDVLIENILLGVLTLEKMNYE